MLVHIIPSSDKKFFVLHGGMEQDRTIHLYMYVCMYLFCPAIYFYFTNIKFSKGMIWRSEQIYSMIIFYMYSPRYIFNIKDNSEQEA
jgi:hypothetical protein